MVLSWSGVNHKDQWDSRRKREREFHTGDLSGLVADRVLGRASKSAAWNRVLERNPWEI